MNSLLENPVLDYELDELKTLIVQEPHAYASDPQNNDNAGTIYSWTRGFGGDEQIGEPDLDECIKCEGSGEIDLPDMTSTVWMAEPCPRCDGTGEVQQDIRAYFSHHYDSALTFGLWFDDYGARGAGLYQDDDHPNCAICFTQAELDHEWSGSIANATRYAQARIKEMSHWLRGEVYGIVTVADPGSGAPEILDSVWGLIGDPSDPYIKAEAMSMLEEAASDQRHEAQEKHRCACADIATITARSNVEVAKRLSIG